MSTWFPVDTSNRRRRSAVATWALLLVVGGMYLLSVLFHLPYETAIRFGVVPLDPDSTGLFAALFFHASGTHFLTNGLLLWFFGRDVEDAYGPFLFLTLYLIGGMSANLAQLGAIRLFLPDDQTLPILGASGAVSTVMGAFAFRYPRSRVVTPYGISGLLPTEYRQGIPTAWVWSLWLFAQFLGMIGSINGGRLESGFWGHLAGFALGITGAFVFETWIGSAGNRSAETVAKGETVPVRALIAQAGAWERAGQHRKAQAIVLRALALAIQSRLPIEGWVTYRWLSDRCAEGEASVEGRIELARLLENERRYELAAEIYESLARETDPETASSLLLSAGRIHAGPMRNIRRALALFDRIEREYPTSRSKDWAVIERERLAQVEGNER